MDFSLRHSHASSYLFILCHARLALFLPTDFSFDFIFAYKIYGLSGLRCLFVSYCFQLFIAISFVFIMLLHANGYFFSSFISFLLLIQFIPVLRIYLFLCGIRKKSTHHQQQQRMQSVFLSAVWFHSLYLKYQFRFNVEMWTERARETGRRGREKNAIEPKIYFSGDGIACFALRYFSISVFLYTPHIHHSSQQEKCYA